MPEKTEPPAPVEDRRSGGVYISGSAKVTVDGDLVGRDKIVAGGGNAAPLAKLLDLIRRIINHGRTQSD